MMNNTIQPHKSSLGGLDANIMALLCYLASSILSFIPVLKHVAWLAPLVIFFMEKESFFVKFHAIQAFLLNIAGAILGFLVSLIFGGMISVATLNPYSAAGYVGAVAFVGVLTTIISLVILVFAVIAMIKAYKYVEYRIPLIGGIAGKLTGRGN